MRYRSSSQWKLVELDKALRVAPVAFPVARCERLQSICHPNELICADVEPFLHRAKGTFDTAPKWVAKGFEQESSCCRTSARGSLSLTKIEGQIRWKEVASSLNGLFLQHVVKAVKSLLNFSDKFFVQALRLARPTKLVRADLEHGGKTSHHRCVWIGGSMNSKHVASKVHLDELVMSALLGAIGNEHRVDGPSGGQDRKNSRNERLPSLQEPFFLSGLRPNGQPEEESYQHPQDDHCCCCCSLHIQIPDHVGACSQGATSSRGWR